jgi:SpoU rRNA methylase family enzyme
MRRSGLGTLLLGIGIGLGIGYLTSPKSGAENREDLKNACQDGIEKLKNIDLNAEKDKLVASFNKLKDELKDMDSEKALAIAKKKGKEIQVKANELIEAAKEKSQPVVEKAAKTVKSNLKDLLQNMADKIED